MLDAQAVGRIAACFGVFEHDWRFYAEFLGEPFLINDVLLYYDGHTLYICAFPLDNPRRELSPSVIQELINSRREFARAMAVNVWGRFAPIPEEIRLGLDIMPLLTKSDYDPMVVDVAVPLEHFSFATHSGPRLARNSARNKGLVTHVRTDSLYTSDHIRMIAYWLRTHPVSPVHTAMATSTQSFIKNPNVHLVESYLNADMKGFALVSLPADGVAVLTQTYIANAPAARIGDSIMAGVIDLALSRQVHRLHLGYSASQSLAQFKRKWGGRLEGPPYREAFYVRTPATAHLVSSGTFLWHERLFLEQLRLTAPNDTEAGSSRSMEEQL